MSAHLCLQIEIKDGNPVVTGAAIFSSDPMHLTSVPGVFYAELFEVAGNYGEAHKQVLDILRSFTLRYKWLYQYFEELK